MSSYYFNDKDNTIWNKYTLKEYSVNSDAAFLIKKMKECPDKVPVDDRLALEGALSEVGIKLNDLEILSSSSKSLQTPIVHIIKNCNSRCDICDCWRTKQPTMLQPESLRRFWKQAELAGAKSVMISGGEPLMHPHLDEIIHDIKSYGLGVELNTNGILLDRNQWLSEENLDALVVSIDGFNSEDYANVRGCDNYYQVMQNISDFKKKSSATLIGGRVTVTSQILSRLFDASSLIMKSGLDVLSFSPLDATSTSFNREMNNQRSDYIINKYVPSANDLKKYLKEFQSNSALSNYVSDMYMQGYFAWGVPDFVRCIRYYLSCLRADANGAHAEPSADSCLFPQCSLVVDYDGSVLPCFYGSPFCSVDEFVSESWNPLELSRVMQESGLCKTCRGKVFCDA